MTRDVIMRFVMLNSPYEELSTQSRSPFGVANVNLPSLCNLETKNNGGCFKVNFTVLIVRYSLSKEENLCEYVTTCVTVYL